ncbi:MAG: NAD(P)/FAD-dependent oxidoreductase [Anaeroplasma sp.]
MKYIIDNLKISPQEDDNLPIIIKEKYGLDIFSFKILHKSIDARKKDNIKILYKIIIDTKQSLKGKDISIYKDDNYKIKYYNWKGLSPVIVGFGPAGMFAALYLARCNAKPIIIERGSSIDERKKEVDDFFLNKKLNTNSNIQFGEGGAGAFSDGKLISGVKSPLKKFILEEFYKHGAKKDILYDAKPHIGTDYLLKIVKSIREEIISLGGSFYFNHTFTDARTIDGDYLNVTINGNKIREIKTRHLLLGLGHSAKDTIRHLHCNMGIAMEQKSFSMGVRIEHLRDNINYSQYKDYSKYLPAAYYNLSTHMPNGRGVYTFCMCPGGFVIPSQSESGTIVTNGMSNNDRGNVNSNSALLVDIRCEDYDKGNVLDGIDFQEKYERLAFSIAKNYKAPANLCKEFLDDKIAKEERSIKASYPHGIFMTDLSKCLPSYVIEGLKYGIKEFDKKLNGFNDPDAVLIGIESRSSSPVRIIRNEKRESSIKGIYPIGEGAGYAGGITSASIDGLKTAMTIMEENHYNCLKK